MSDNTVFPALDVFREVERSLFEDPNLPFALSGFCDGLNSALDRIGFTKDYVDREVDKLNSYEADKKAIEHQGSSVSKVVKDIVWGMIELDRTAVAILDTPILQRLRYVRQNGFTYLVYPAASHVRLEHSLGVLAVVSKYIASINASAVQESKLARGLVAKEIDPTLALDLKHAAILHDIGHFPLSHVLETIFESDPTSFKIGGVLIRDFEICIVTRLKDLKSRLSEKLSIAIILSPRFKAFYTALRKDPWAYLRVACLVSGTPLSINAPGYSQLISGAVDCDKVDYLLRDSQMCNVPVAIDQARLFLNSALIECTGDTVRKLSDKGVLSLSTDLNQPALTLVLNSSGVDTIEEVAFARATLYERVYRHPVTRNAERVLSVAIGDAAENGDQSERWHEALHSYEVGDDTFIDRLLKSKSKLSEGLALSLRRRQLPKRAFAFSPDFYVPIVPYVSIFSNLSPSEAASTYYHEVTSKDPFHEVVQSLKERSDIFRSNAQHREIECRIVAEALSMAKKLNEISVVTPTEDLNIFFVPLPDHSTTPTSCAIVTHEGELESSGDYSRAAQLVSAKEIGRSVGFVTCDAPWAEIVFLAAQSILYDYFGNEIVEMDLNLQFDHADDADEFDARPNILKLKAVKRFYIAEQLAVRRCRLNRGLLTSHRMALSKAGFYDTKPRLAEPEPLTPEIEQLASRFREFSGQHGWRVTSETLRQFLNQFPPRYREDARKALSSFNFLNRTNASKLLWNAIQAAVDEIRKTKTFAGMIHVVPLAGTSAAMMIELSKQENRERSKSLNLYYRKSVHELLGVAKSGDAAIFVDDNVSSGTQFSAQLLRWMGLQQKSLSEDVRREDGIESFELDPNAKTLLSSLQIRLATCVGKKASEAAIQGHLKAVSSGLDFCGATFGRKLTTSTSEALDPKFREFLAHVGAECIRSAKGIEVANEDCHSKALGYGNSEGRTVTLWNVPTSTLTAFWCPGLVDGEPWFPLFIRRGYADKLVVA